MSPTARTLARLRKHGYIAGVTERFIAGAGEHGQGIRRDLFGCIDLVAVKVGVPVLGVQATTIGHIAHRLAKARAIGDLRTWLAAGCLFQVWGWVQRDGRWLVKIVNVQAGDLGDVVLEQPKRARRKSRWQPGDLFGGAGFPTGQGL